MPLSWNEIKHRAITFSKEWKDETREEAEAKSFWDAFSHVFGQQRRARVEHLFALYEKLTSPLATTGKAKLKHLRKAGVVAPT